MKKCKGCGAVLQSTAEEKKGYTPKEDALVCQRCFRIKNYDDLVKSYRDSFDNNDILNQIAEIDALVIWVVDLFDFESNIIAGLNRHLIDKDIIMVATKRDLLPDTLGNEKLLNFVNGRLREYGIDVAEIIFVGEHGYDGRDVIMDVIDIYRRGRDVVMMGMANAGKSTLINALTDSNLTISRYPGTTLDFSKIELDDYSLIDTPGLINQNSIQVHVNDKDLKDVIPSKITPKVYQLRSSASFAIAGLLRLDLVAESECSVVFYINRPLTIHRGKIDNADDLWQRQLGELLKPISEEKLGSLNDFAVISNSMDIVVLGLGFITIKGKVDRIAVQTVEGVDVIVREALM